MLLRWGAAAVRRSASAEALSEPTSSATSSSSTWTRCRLPISDSSSSRGLTVCLGDLAQGDDRILVAVAVDGELGAARNLARPLRGQQHQVESVGDFVDAVFDGYARHAAAPLKYWCFREGRGRRFIRPKVNDSRPLTTRIGIST